MFKLKSTVLTVMLTTDAILALIVFIIIFADLLKKRK